MRDQLLSLVTPVFRTGLQLRDEWSRGEGPPFDAGRELLLQAFRELFAVVPSPVNTTTGSQQFELKGASLFEIDLTAGDAGAAARMPTVESYLGVGYALASWVDELFTLNSPVAAKWNERKFEVEFFATNDRAWRFWRQARMAADRPGDDDLEVFYLCAALGFRGEWAEEPGKLRAWLGASRDRLVKGLRQEWVGPPALDPPAHVPPRYGKARVRRMATFAGFAILLAIPAAVVLIARQLAH
jgi:type VI protein secretion system component VasF